MAPKSQVPKSNQVEELYITQAKWLEELGIPFPNHQVLDEVANSSPAHLAPKLQEFGAYISYLESQVGLWSGRANALKSTFDNAVAVRAYDYTGGSEKAKASAVLAEHEEVREVKRMQIEAELILDTAKGMCAGYIRAWETVSRITTIKLAENDLQGRRAI